MRPPNLLIRLAAVASSLLLVGGFVAYRAGAFSRTNTPIDTGLSGETSPSPPPKDTTMMGGSKSMNVFIPDFKQPPMGSNPPTIMSGSKSLAPLVPPAKSGDRISIRAIIRSSLLWRITTVRRFKAYSSTSAVAVKRTRGGARATAVPPSTSVG